jgi:hypothetical protein
MTDQHRATPEQWAQIERSAEEAHGDGCSTILELRARVAELEADQLEQAESHRFCTDAIVRRVEALEAAQQPQDKLDRLIALDRDDPTPDPAMAELRAASAEAQPGGLVERVAARIEYGIDAELDPEGIARAVICEQAAWLRSVGNNGSADELEQQADHG